jgi:hypothetical protein
LDNWKVQQFDFVPLTNPFASQFGGLLRVSLVTPLGANSIQVNDYMRFSELDKSGTTAWTSSQKHGFDKLSQYLSGQQGVQVIGVELSNTGRITALLVKIAGSINSSTGAWVNDTDMIGLFTDISIIPQQSTLVWNMSLQVSVCLQATAETPTVSTVVSG